VFVPGKPFQPSLKSVFKARSLPYSGVSESCNTRVGSGLTRKQWISVDMPGTNTLAEYENSQLTVVKSFIILVPEGASVFAGRVDDVGRGLAELFVLGPML